VMDLLRSPLQSDAQDPSSLTSTSIQSRRSTPFSGSGPIAGLMRSDLPTEHHIASQSGQFRSHHLSVPCLCPSLLALSAGRFSWDQRRLMGGPAQDGHAIDWLGLVDERPRSLTRTDSRPSTLSASLPSSRPPNTETRHSVTLSHILISLPRFTQHPLTRLHPVLACVHSCGFLSPLYNPFHPRGLSSLPLSLAEHRFRWV
jgi:hypothetical protein